MKIFSPLFVTLIILETLFVPNAFGARKKVDCGPKMNALTDNYSYLEKISTLSRNETETEVQKILQTVEHLEKTDSNKDHFYQNLLKVYESHKGFDHTTLQMELAKYVLRLRDQKILFSQSYIEPMLTAVTRSAEFEGSATPEAEGAFQFLLKAAKENPERFAAGLRRFDQETDTTLFDDFDMWMDDIEKWLSGQADHLDEEDLERITKDGPWIRELLISMGQSMEVKSINNVLDMTPTLKGDEHDRHQARWLNFRFRLTQAFMPFFEVRPRLEVYDRFLMASKTSPILHYPQRASRAQNQNLIAEAERKGSDFGGKAVIKALETRVHFKKELFSASPLKNEVKNLSSWLAVHDPEVVRNLVESQLLKNSKLRERFTKLLKVKLNYSIRELQQDPSIYIFYADEIFDTLKASARELKLQDTELEIAISSEAYQFRFIQRITKDISLGDKCGDCTSVGSVNYGRSLTWLYNSSYQIMTFSKDSRFLGKVGLALVDIEHRPAILIDSIEFNPQVEVSGSYQNDGHGAVKALIEFLKIRSEEMNRGLYALVASNSSDAKDVLQRYEIDHLHSKDGYGYKKLQVSFPFDDEGIHSALGLDPNRTLKPWYQILSFSSEIPSFTMGEITKNYDPLIQNFESNVLNPLQLQDERIGRILSQVHGATEDERSKIFSSAAAIILEHPEAVTEAKRIYGIPENLDIGQSFLTLRLQVMFNEKTLRKTSSPVFVRDDDIIRIH
jgi:hypothetical protein